MNVSSAFASLDLDALKAELGDGTFTVYSVARPLSADLPVDRSGVLAQLTFASPAFAPATDGGETPIFTEEAAMGQSVGTPGFVRLCKEDGTVVADLSAGPGRREVKFTEVSVSKGAPVKVASLRFLEDGSWPERPDYYDAHPKSGYEMPKTL